MSTKLDISFKNITESLGINTCHLIQFFLDVAYFLVSAVLLSEWLREIVINLTESA